MKEKIKNIAYLLRILLIMPGIRWNDKVFEMDLRRWKEIYELNMSNLMALAWLLWTKQEFRNLFIYRNRNSFFYRKIIKILYPPMNTLFIEACEIGGGLFIQHGFATMISAKYIGKNCWINQQVTIGYRGKNMLPVIGDNVMITCGAKVLGNITVGDNSVVGANAVVISDVEEDSVMVGIPAKRIK
jgi:serine O-acetyltransferase